MKQLRSGGISLAFLWTFLVLAGQEKEKAGSFMVADSIETAFYLHTDKHGLPGYYSSRIITPVCEGGKCYTIELDLSWDLAGHFSGYDTLRGKVLTKLDHIPFENRDYRKLLDLLGEPDSPLGLYNSKELVRKQRKSSIDGFTGATLEEIKTAVVEGAVYSCFTLWHIAQGTVKDSIRKKTASLASAELFRKFVPIENDALNLLLIRSMRPNDLLICFPEVIQSIRQAKGYYGKQVFESLPGEILAYENTQHLLAERYTELDYFTRIALLEKIDRHQLRKELEEVLQKELDEINSYENELIKKLLNIE